jgi:hypothetical protein
MISEIKYKFKEKTKQNKNKKGQNEIGHSPAAGWVFSLDMLPLFSI